jgi:hypothetical protein
LNPLASRAEDAAPVADDRFEQASSQKRENQYSASAVTAFSQAMTAK